MPDSPSPNGANRPASGKPTARAKSAKGRRAAHEPCRDETTGRTSTGRFAPGNPGGPGNPYAKAIGQLRSALLAAVNADDIRDIIARLVQEAKSGNIAAAREVLDRCLGRPVEADILERLESLEQTLDPSKDRP